MAGAQEQDLLSTTNSSTRPAYIMRPPKVTAHAKKRVHRMLVVFVAAVVASCLCTCVNGSLELRRRKRLDALRARHGAKQLVVLGADGEAYDMQPNLAASEAQAQGLAAA